MTTADAALRLRITPSAASRILTRLASKDLVARLHHGLWSLQPDIDPLLLPEYLTAPLPSYVSLQTALYFHRMISQIPRVIYAASLGRTRRVTTSIGTYSIHQLLPEFFGGWRDDNRAGVKIAVPEKALLDTLYLAAAKNRLFVRLPEVELPPTFSIRECRRWIAKIPAEYRRTMVARRLEAILAER